MKIFKKTVSAICVLAIVVSLFCSCGEKKAEITVGNKKYSADTTVLTVEGEEVTLEFFRYCFLTVKKALLEEDSKLDFSKKENADRLNQEVLGQVKYIIGVEKLAEKYGYALDDKDYAEIEEAMKSVFDKAGGATAYKDLLGENFMNHEIYKRMLSANKLETKMSESLCGTDSKKNGVTFTSKEAADYFYENVWRMMTMTFAIEGTENLKEPMDDKTFEKNKAAAKAKAESALKEVKSGKSFEEVFKKHNPDSYEYESQSYYTLDEVVPTGENIGYDLEKMKIGDVSDVVYYSNNFYIIKRLELDKEYIEKNIDYNTAYADKVFAETVNAKIDSLKVEETELYKSITAESLV